MELWEQGKVSCGNTVSANELYGKDVPYLQKVESLGICSNNFYIEKNEANYKVVCLGNGHGLGLSQYGANKMAGEDCTYEEILLYYFPNVTLNNMRDK